MPIPPSLASAMAMLASVTVSILALINGIFREMLVESRVRRSVCDLEITADLLGTRRTSSNVSPSFISKFSLICLGVYCYKPSCLVA